MAQQAYVLPNRKAFSEYIVRIFRNYRDSAKDADDEAEDLCMKQAGSTSRELLSYQKLVRDYLLIETPYRGLLLYHGLGSGKTCSSIAIAESLMTTKKVFILSPASLIDNYRGEIRKCGGPIYQESQYWEVKSIQSPEDREQAKGMGISDSFLDKNGRFFVTVPARQANYKTLPLEMQRGISAQIDDLIDQRFRFIAYNSPKFAESTAEAGMFDDSVVIIDEAHNLMNSLAGEKSEIRMKAYDSIYRAKNTKVVCLSGTPVINNPIEISYMMNLLRGPIERVEIPTKSATNWDEALMTTFFKGMKDVDTIEYNSVKREIKLTRNPPYFESVYNEKGDRIAVKYSKDFEQESDLTKWVGTWKSKFEVQFAGIELEEGEKIKVNELQCLPTDFEEFANLFIDGLAVKNPLLLGRRIQGLVSYFRGADERLVPKRLEEENTLVKVPMSNEQFVRYLEARKIEIEQEAKKSRGPVLNEDFKSTFRAKTRGICNYAVPTEYKPLDKRAMDDDWEQLDVPEIIEKLKQDADKYLKGAGLKIFGPKMAVVLEQLQANVGSAGKFNSQMVYSNFKSLEGVGIMAAVLEANGFQPYKLIKKPGGVWEEDPEMKEGVPAYATFTGATGESDRYERELVRQIFNGDYSQDFPQSLKDSIKEKRLCVFLISRAGAEGISLSDVRNVYILEPYWNTALIDQAIGRAIRICSHKKLPQPDRTVTVKVYLSTFTDEQKKTTDAPDVVMIRRADTERVIYEGEAKQVFSSTDEHIYNIAYQKSRIGKNISHILKQSAVDCEIHRKLHAKEKPVIQCMRFDTTVTGEDLAYKPGFKVDEKDTLYMRNIVRRERRLQRIKAKDMTFILDPGTNEVFDDVAYQDTQRLIRLGIRTAPGEIRFFTV